MMIHSVTDIIASKDVLHNQLLSVSGILCVTQWRIIRPITAEDAGVIEEIDKPGYIRRYVRHSFLLPESLETEIDDMSAPVLRHFADFNSPWKRLLRHLPNNVYQSVSRFYSYWAPVAVFLNDPRIEYLLFDADIEIRDWSVFPYRFPAVVTGRVSTSPFPDYVSAIDQIELIYCKKHQMLNEDITFSIPPTVTAFADRDWEAMPRSKNIITGKKTRPLISGDDHEKI